MPENWQGISGGMGRGADGAAPSFMDYHAQPQARQSVASRASLTTLRRKYGISAVGGDSRGGTSRHCKHRLSPHVQSEAISFFDGNAGGMERA
jgi:hypothetical protein